MIRLHPKKPDWYLIPFTPENSSVLADVPVCRVFDKQHLEIPRSHLPLFDLGRVFLQDELTQSNIDFERRCLARNARTEPLGFLLRPHQHVGVEYAARRRGLLVADEMRTGKALAATCKVLTPVGWRLMGDLVVGDRVIDPDGGVATVTGVYPQGLQDIWEVTTNDDGTTYCTQDHLWLIWSSNQKHRGSAGHVKALSDFQSALVDSNGNSQAFLPLCAPVTGFLTRDLPIHPYVLGALLGDGNLTSNTPVITKPDKAFIAKVAEFYTEGISMLDEKTGTFSVLNAGKYIRDLRLNVCTSTAKFIPPQYLTASAEDRLLLLQGLMDTDGEASPTGAVFSSSSKLLMDGLRHLVWSLGGSATLSCKAEPKYTYKGEKRVGQPAYRSTVRLPVNPFLAATKSNKWLGPGFNTRSIKNVVAAAPQEAICIAVDSKRNLFVTDDYIVTHNTVQSLNFHEPTTGPLVIATPLSVRENWAGWSRRVFPDARISIITGKTFDRVKLDADIVIGHYDILPAWQDANFKIGTLILDEAHILSNRKSKRTLAANLLASRASKIAALSGTPLWNKPQQLWPLLGLVAPGQFGGFHEFATRYTVATPSAWGAKYEGTANEDELKSRLTEIMLYRRWSDVAKDLPTTTRDVLLVDLTPQQRVELDLIVEAGRSAADTSTTIGAIAQYRSTLSLVKAPIAIEAAKHDLDRGERVVVWTWHKSAAKFIYDALKKKYSAFIVTGDISAQKREEAMTKWKETPASVLVITISVGQVGIDLSASHLAIFAEVDFTPALIAQAEMRTYAPTRSMNIRYTIADHPAERGIIDALCKKLENSDRIGVPAAEAAIDVLKNAFMLPDGEGDLDRLLQDLIASAHTAG